MFAVQSRLTYVVLICLLFPAITHATHENNSGWSPYLSLAGGFSSQRIYNVTFENPRRPEIIQNSHNSAVPFGSFALGTKISSLPLRLELQTTVNGRSNFNREYFFPSFFSVVGVQKLNIRSNYLMVKGYYELPFRVLIPYISLGAGTSWNKTTATQYAPQLPGWIYDFEGTTKTDFSWSAGIGFSKHLVKNLTLNVGFNYVALGKFDTGVLPKTGDEHIFGKLYSNELLVGFSYYL